MPRTPRAAYRSVPKPDGWRACRHCGHDHTYDASAAAHWHEEHDVSMGLQTDQDGYTKTRWHSRRAGLRA